MQCLMALKKALTRYEEKIKTIHTSSMTAVLEEGFALTELTSQGRRRKAVFDKGPCTCPDIRCQMSATFLDSLTPLPPSLHFHATSLTKLPNCISFWGYPLPVQTSYVHGSYPSNNTVQRSAKRLVSTWLGKISSCSCF